MHLIDHISITVRDLHAALPFYRAVMEVLGAPLVYARDDAVGFGQRNRSGDELHTYLSLLQSERAVADPRRHWCFKAGSRPQVVAFHAAGLAAAGRCDGPPGLRDYHPHYFAAFLLDPDGNRLEAVCHRAPRPAGKAAAASRPHQRPPHT